MGSIRAGLIEGTRVATSPYRRSFSSSSRLMRTCVEIESADDEGFNLREHSQFQAGRRHVDNSQRGRVCS